MIRALVILVHREGWRMPGYLSFEYITPQKLQNKQEGKEKMEKKGVHLIDSRRVYLTSKNFFFGSFQIVICSYI